MSGIAAFAFCAAFTSCSKSDLYDQSAVDEKNQQELLEKENAVRASYEAAFEKAFGQVGANVDWGFGTRSNTRATGEFANHIGAYPDANMWTSKGFLAPDPLTPSQKLRAQYYFQMNRITRPNRPDNGQIDFFMQQVYDGGTNPMPGKSPEVYDAADGNTKINSGEHMDHLTCGPDHTHTYNFNNGTCSTNDNVANRDQTDVNNTDGKQQHSDEIQLMLNTKTSCFGYANSDASYVRDDRWTLVSAQTIDDFCDGDTGFKTWLNAELAKLPADANKNDVKCVDEFNRSYIGFDFDMIPDESVYSLTPCDANGNIVYDTYNNPIDHYENNYLTIQIYNNDKIWNGTALVDLTDVGEWGTDRYNNRVFYPYMPGTTEKVRLLSENKNQYCGTSETWSDDDWKYTANGTTYTSIANMISALNNFKLPSNDKTWVTIGNCADGYYSDWIVTFMPADSGDIPEIHNYRVIAEDLNAQEDTDFDFNDVVFDVEPNEAKTAAKIILRAAGGIYKLTVAGIEVHEAFAAAYPDAGYGVGANGLYPMINTNPWNPDIKVTLIENYEGDFSDASIRNTIKGIEIKVYKPGFEENGIALDATTGKAACKILVDDTFTVVTERFGIADEYHDFTTYVQGYFANEFWWKRGTAPQTGN